jgi:hypothetical protein
MRADRAAPDDADDDAWRLGFPREPSREVASSLRESDARLERRWRAFVANGRDARARGELVRAFARANGVGREARPRLWFAWSGAEAAKRASDTTYEEYLRAAELSDDAAAATTRDAQIEMDLARTFPEHARFAETGDGLPALRRVLRATATSAAAGYVQGMNYLGGFLLLVMETEEDAFWTLHVVVDVMFAGYFTEGLKSLRADLDTLDHRFRCVSSEAHAKLESMGLAVKYFTARWLMCALIGCASVPIVLRVWDLIFVDADREPRETIMRSSLAILALQAPWIRAAEDMSSSVECIREAGSTIDNIEAYLQRVSLLRETHFPSKPAPAPAVTPTSRKRTSRYEPPPTPARAAMTPVANTLYASLVSFFSPTPSKTAVSTPRASGLAPKRLWSFEETQATPKRTRVEADGSGSHAQSSMFAKSKTPLKSPARSPLLAAR